MLTFHNRFYLVILACGVFPVNRKLVRKKIDVLVISISE